MLSSGAISTSRSTSRPPELKEVGAGLQLSPNGTRAFYELGVDDPLKALSCEATGKEIRLWNTGETWKLFDLGKVSSSAPLPYSPSTARTC